MKQFFVDYDEVSLSVIKEDMFKIASKLGSVCFTVLKTSRGHYHLIVRDIDMTLDEVVEILKETSCDKNYLNMMILKQSFYRRVGRKMIDGKVVADIPKEVSI